MNFIAAIKTALIKSVGMPMEPLRRLTSFSRRWAAIAQLFAPSIYPTMSASACLLALSLTPNLLRARTHEISVEYESETYPKISEQELAIFEIPNRIQSEIKPAAESIKLASWEMPEPTSAKQKVAEQEFDANETKIDLVAGVELQEGPATWDVPYEVGALFDKGLYIRGKDLKKNPYSIYFGGRLQLRHAGFTRDEQFWTDSAGVTREIRNRNRFETERARLNISGTVLDPNLSYYIIYDGDEDGAANVDQLAYIFTYKVDEALKLRIGRWKAASDREWLTSSRHLRMVDRSMATEFFRVAFTDGIWLLGDIGNGWHYETSFTNGLRTSSRRTTSLDDGLGGAATLYVDPLGDFGQGDVDYACHTSPVVRIGGSFAVDKSLDRSDAGFALGDGNYLRLTDGTALNQTGALAPGVRVLGVRTLKGGLDFAIKYRGASLDAEYFLRSLQDFTADGALPLNQINDRGYRVGAGIFLVPKRLDINGRLSQISGPFGDAFEYSLGSNWYWGSGKRDGKLDDRVNKLSFDVTELKGNPAASGPSDLVPGDDGVLFRTQLQIGF